MPKTIMVIKMSYKSLTKILIYDKTLEVNSLPHFLFFLLQTLKLSQLLLYRKPLYKCGQVSSVS